MSFYVFYDYIRSIVTWNNKQIIFKDDNSCLTDRTELIEVTCN